MFVLHNVFMIYSIYILFILIMITGNDFGTVEKERLLRKYQG